MSSAPKTSALDLIKRGRNQFRTVDFPGVPDKKVALRVLTEKQLDECRVEAWNWVKENFNLDPEALRGSLHYDRELYSRMLAKSLLVADGVEDLQTPLATDVENLKDQLTPGERKALVQELADFTAEVDPNLDTAEGTAAAVALVEEAKKKGLSRAALELLLKDLPPAIVRRSFITLVEQYQNLRKAKSSPSSSKD